MKKLFVATCLMVGFAGMAIAQTTPPAKTATTIKPTAKIVKPVGVKPPTPVMAPAKISPAVKPVTTVKPVAAPVVKPTVVKPTVVKTAPIKTTTATPLKADGTPDMRYKVNKAKPVGPLKKDGTPDMRYKANKPVVKP